MMANAREANEWLDRWKVARDFLRAERCREREPVANRLTLLALVDNDSDFLRGGTDNSRRKPVKRAISAASSAPNAGFYR